jgi:hypothetical protein
VKRRLDRAVGNSDAAEVLHDRIYQLERVLDIVSDLGTGDDDLSGDKNQEHDLGPDHVSLIVLPGLNVSFPILDV